MRFSPTVPIGLVLRPTLVLDPRKKTKAKALNETSVGNKKVSCRREAARCLVSFNISLGHSVSLKIIRKDI